MPRGYCLRSLNVAGRIPLIVPVISLPLTLSQPVASGPVIWMSFPDMMPLKNPARPRWGPLILDGALHLLPVLSDVQG